MKHKFLLLILLFLGANVNAQSITISGAKNGTNGAYSFYKYVTIYDNPTVPNAVLGTPIYRKVRDAYWNFWDIIYRRGDGKWFIGWYGASSSTPISFKPIHSIESTSDTLLPCYSLWTDYGEYGHTLSTTSTITVTSGTCDSAYPISSATEVEPGFVRLPNLPSAAAPASPKNGTMYYDLSTHTVKVYSNGLWKTLAWQ